MVDFSSVRLPNTKTEGDFLGIEMDFLEVHAPEKRIAAKAEEKEPEAKPSS